MNIHYRKSPFGFASFPQIGANFKMAFKVVPNADLRKLALEFSQIRKKTAMEKSWELRH